MLPLVERLGPAVLGPVSGFESPNPCPPVWARCHRASGPALGTLPLDSVSLRSHAHIGHGARTWVDGAPIGGVPYAGSDPFSDED